MKVSHIERAPPGGSTVAIASVQITPEIKVNGLRLVRGNSGAFRVYSPNAGGLAVLHFAPNAVTELKRIITEAYESEIAANDHHIH